MYPRRLALFLVLALLSCPSCVQFFTKNHRSRPTPAMEINGAGATSALKPVFGESKFNITESIFLPSEIVEANRGNPREWDW